MTIEKMLWKTLYRRDWYTDKKDRPMKSSVASPSIVSNNTTPESPPGEPKIKQKALEIKRPKFKGKQIFGDFYINKKW